jgi:hypothetical protein
MGDVLHLHPLVSFYSTASFVFSVFRAFVILFFLSVLTASIPAVAVELRSEEAVVRVERDGCGLIDEIRFHDRPMVKVHDGLGSARITLADVPAADDEPLFPHSAGTVLRASIAEISEAGGKLTVRGSYSDGKLSVPFTREMAWEEKNTLAIRETADFRSLPDNRLAAGHELDLPLVLASDEHDRLMALGGTKRDELFRMDMNDQHRRNQLISSSRAFWPSWDLGGLVQLPGSYEIWRANRADTMAYPIDAGRGAAGWADYSDPTAGITLAVPRPAEAAPFALTIDARQGLLTAAPLPKSQLPQSAKALGFCEFRFVLVLHPASWPARHPCELSPVRYREFLVWLNQGNRQRYTYLDYVCAAVGVEAPEGPKTQEQFDAVCRAIIDKERIQPSVVLRVFYREDGWRMSGLAQLLLRREIPRTAPMAVWESLQKELIGRLSQGNLPRWGDGR